MKLFDFAIIIALSSAFICQPTDGAEFYFKKDSVKFPDTKEGVILEHEFPFTNIGQEPLIISGYNVECSCTEADFPKDPIHPGETGVVKMRFDSKDKYGLQIRTIDLISNAKKKPVYSLKFKVYIIPDED